MTLFDGKRADPVMRPTARDALVYAAGAQHGGCTVTHKSPRRGGKVTFACVCKTKYTVGANDFIVSALRNVPEDAGI